jgi:hypothetical protein
MDGVLWKQKGEEEREQGEGEGEREWKGEEEIIKGYIHEEYHI